MSNTKLGDNSQWFLGELASADLGQIETGEIEIFGEDDQGHEGSCTIEVTEIARAALELIDEQSASIKGLQHELAIAINALKHCEDNTNPNREEIAEEALDIILRSTP